MAMGHVILREFFVDRQVPYFTGYAPRFTDAPFLVTLRRARGRIRAGAVPDRGCARGAARACRVQAGRARQRDQQAVAPGGSLGLPLWRRGLGRWNLELGDIEPMLTLHGEASETVTVDLPRFDAAGRGGRADPPRGAARRIGGQLVTTVFDLLLAQYGVGREGLPGHWPACYDDPGQPCTPAWQEAITGVPASCVGADRRGSSPATRRTPAGRSMIAWGPGPTTGFTPTRSTGRSSRWLCSCGCQGVNGGGWAHYVGQEKVRPLTGWQTLAFALDWVRPPRHRRDPVLVPGHRPVAL